jgi:hypothetical protein
VLQVEAVRLRSAETLAILHAHFSRQPQVCSLTLNHDLVKISTSNTIAAIGGITTEDRSGL